MDLQVLEFMAKEMLTTDLDTERHVGEMFVAQKQAGEDIAKQGANLRRLQQRYELLPHHIPGKGYPQSDLARDGNRIAAIKD